MTKLLYWRLARNNLWKNRQTYAPFLLATVMLTFTMYSFAEITMNPGLRQVPGYTSFLMMLSMGMVVVGVFAAIFLFYANSFLIKRRKKEMGLYGILGMEKRHIARVIRHELSLCYTLSMIAGLGLGMLLSRFLFLLIRQILQVEISLEPVISNFALIMPPALFAGLFILLMLYNSYQVRAVSPIELLRGGQVGEKEPKSRWFFGIIGAVTLGVGYYIALTVRNPVSAIGLFFVAVVLVIIGTYLLFMAGSLTILKMLKNNKRFYYQPRHFVTVSGMLYRMKQNAAGLASIAILVTMAMITVGTTVGLYRGADDALHTMYPSDLKLNVHSAEDIPLAEAAAERAAQRTGVTLTTLKAFTSYEDILTLEGNELRHAGELSSKMLSEINEYGDIMEISVLTADVFNALEGTALTLAENEIYWYSPDTKLSETVNIEGRDYKTTAMQTLSFVPSFTSGGAVGTMYMVVKDEEAVRALLPTLGSEDQSAACPVHILQADVSGSAEEKDAFVSAFREESPKYYALFNKSALRTELFALYGGFLFVGIFLGTLFLMATALIIYFKQISEGYQDQDRFLILQKVGMSEGEVRKTVNAQILIVFFLPLLVAVCHVAGSLQMITLMLRVLRLTDIPYIALNVFLSAGFVAVLYLVFYLKTAKTYFKLVKW